MNHNQIIGKFGETLAKKYLIKHGYDILNENVKLSYQELDIIALKNKQIIFVEVKTRISQQYGSAENAMMTTKLNRFKRAIEMFIENKNLTIDDIRADLITIDIDRKNKIAKIKHYFDII
jgi:putative endonuclease